MAFCLRRLAVLASVATQGIFVAGAGAEPLVVSVRADAAGVPGVVVQAHPVGAAATVRGIDAVMDQINSEFVPRVLPVPRGSQVSFPNSDVTRHQVYSFSPAKRFELPLYSGTPPAPVRFETAGVVTLGCNIHDAMVGYIVVVDTPYYALSNGEGVATIADLPAGDYRIVLWHERMAESAPANTVAVSAGKGAELALDVTLAPPPPPRGDDRLRALQERFKAIQRERD